MSNKPGPLPFSETIRDLALLRVADLNLASILPPSTSTAPSDPEVDLSVQRSYDFAKEARTVIKINNRGDVETEGSKVENVRSKLEDALHGLERTGS